MPILSPRIEERIKLAAEQSSEVSVLRPIAQYTNNALITLYDAMAVTSVSETAIFERIALPDEPELSKQLAQCLLALRFGAEDQERMQLVAGKARDGSLTPSE